MEADERDLAASLVWRAVDAVVPGLAAVAPHLGGRGRREATAQVLVEEDLNGVVIPVFGRIAATPVGTDRSGIQIFIETRQGNPTNQADQIFGRPERWETFGSKTPGGTE